MYGDDNMKAFESFEAFSDAGLGSGFSGNAMDVIEQFNKSLTVGYGYNLTDKTGGGALRLESLDETLKYVTFQEKAAAFWLAAPKKKAFSTIEEYTTVNEVEGAQFYAEGGVPDEATDELKRAYEQVKYLGAIGKISDVISMVKTQANARTIEQQNKTRAMIRLADKSGWFGDSRYNTYEFDGIYRQVERKATYFTQQVIDLRGKRLRLQDINRGATIIGDNYGDPMNLRLWMSLQAKEDYLNELTLNKQFYVNNGNPNQIIGLDPDQFKVGNGAGRIDTDVFLGQYPEKQKYPRLNSSGSSFVSTHSKAPNAPTASVAVSADATSLMDADTYDYAVVAINRFGASIPTEIANVVVGALEKVTFTLADNGSPAGQEATAYRIYRRQGDLTGKTDYRYLFTVGEGDVTNNVDRNTFLPDTTMSFMIDWNPDQVFSFHQLLPMFKKPLAPIGDYEWWLQKLYVTPIVYNANKIVIFRNVGSQAWA